MKKEIIIASAVVALAIVGCQQKETDTSSTYRRSAATNTIVEPAGAVRMTIDTNTVNTNSLNSLSNQTNSIPSEKKSSDSYKDTPPPSPTPDQSK